MQIIHAYSLLYILESETFYSSQVFLFCFIISLIIYFISSSERKGQELHSNMWKKGRVGCILNTLQVFLLKIDIHAASLSPLLPSHTQVCQHHFSSTISPKTALSYNHFPYPGFSIPILCLFLFSVFVFLIAFLQTKNYNF